ncbi:MAG: CHAT domain-containing protein [Gemmatimonadaceae bacterium]
MTMAKAPLTLDGFLTAYRALLSDIVEHFGAQWLARLLASPLGLDAVIGIVAPKRRINDLVRKIPEHEREQFEAAARDAIRETIERRSVPKMAAAEEIPMAAEPAPAEDEERPRGWARAMPPMAMAPPQEFEEEEAGGLLGVAAGGESADDPLPEDVPPPPPPPDQPEDDAPDEPRFLNARIAGRRKNEPIEPATEAVLEVFVGLQEEGDASARVAGAGVLFGTGEDTITLTVQVTSKEFKVEQASLPLTLPRSGPSRGKARFDITPLVTGPGTLTISVNKDGNFLLQMQVTYTIGTAAVVEPPTQKVNGRAINSAEQLKRRELGLTITPGANVYECEVRGATHTKVSLPLKEAELGDAVKAARDALLAVIGMRDAKRVLVFQAGIDIDADSQARALGILARAGAALFRALFYGAKAGKDVRDIGDLVRRLATKKKTQLTIQVVAQDFPVPWGMLYMGDDADGAVLDWDFFLGMRHVIEVIPLQTDMLVDDTVIVSDNPALSLSVNVNAGIDAQMKSNVVARQVKYWDDGAKSAGARLGLSQRSTKKDVLDALRAKTPDQVMYFYCHAVTNAPTDPAGIKGSYLVFTNDEHVSVEDLERQAPIRDSLPGNPLVFINACESGELRPEFYDGFIPYFMAKGARGVVGTECKTPAIFATEWALEFFPRFLGGEPLGDLFLDLRRQFTQKHGNPLGLVYAVYCDGDTQVEPALTL